MKPVEKLKELIRACIYYGSDDDGRITKTKLAKLVYLADFAYYYYELKPITGVEYIKFKNGPVSKDFFKIVLDTNLVEIVERKNARMCSLKKPFVKSSLSKSEIDIVKKVCEKWKGKITKEVVSFTHKQMPWKISFDGDVVPYSLIIQEDESMLF